MSRKDRNVIWALTGVCAVVALIVVVSASDSASLRALKDDPIARYEPPGGRLLDSSEQDEGRYWWGFGSFHGSEYRRLFELPPGDRERHLRHALEVAAATGWTVTVRNTDRMAEAPAYPELDVLSGTGFKTLEVGRARVAFTVFRQYAPYREGAGPAMLVRLSHDR
jgi:hypothetical protein